MEEVFVHNVRVSGLGEIWMAAGRKGLLALEPCGGRGKLEEFIPNDAVVKKDRAPFVHLLKFLSQLASGKTAKFEGAKDLRGTSFQISVWKAIFRIPWGETRSYEWLAKAAGRPAAIRAAASACGANPLPLVIPCHRVIAKDGTIGGFSSGLPLKRKLLALEGHAF